MGTLGGMTTEDSTPDLPLPELPHPDAATDPGEPTPPVSFFERARDFLLGHPDEPVPGPGDPVTTPEVTPPEVTPPEPDAPPSPGLPTTVPEPVPGSSPPS